MFTLSKRFANSILYNKSKPVRRRGGGGRPWFPSPLILKFREKKSKKFEKNQFSNKSWFVDVSENRTRRADASRRVSSSIDVLYQYVYI
jgi:hypothetical protein